MLCRRVLGIAKCSSRFNLTPDISTARFRHHLTKDTDATYEIEPHQILVSRNLLKPRKKEPGKAIVHEQPLNAESRGKEPVRPWLTKPRWPEEFVIEPMLNGKWGLVAMESARVRPNPVTACKHAMVKAMGKDKSSALWIRYYPDYPVCRPPPNSKKGKGHFPIDHWVDPVLAGRVLFEFNTHVANATIIMHEVQKRFPIKLMLVSGEKHKNVVKVTSNADRDRLGFKIHSYSLEYADGTTAMWKMDKKWEDVIGRKHIMENMQLDYSFYKRRSQGTNRFRMKTGQPF